MDDTFTTSGAGSRAPTWRIGYRRTPMGAFLFDLSIRVLNAGIGGFLGFAMLLNRRSRWIARDLGLEYDDLLLLTTVAGAVIGFVWGAKLWSLLDRKLDKGWSRRGR
jgi:hypothetical protein